MPQQLSHSITPIAQITRCLVRTAFRRNLLLVSGQVVVAVTVLYFGRPVAAGNIVWDGGGTTENWSDDANCVGNVRPGPADLAVFDGTSSKSATIDISFNVVR